MLNWINTKSSVDTIWWCMRMLQLCPMMWLIRVHCGRAALLVDKMVVQTALTPHPMHIWTLTDNGQCVKWTSCVEDLDTQQWWAINSRCSLHRLPYWLVVDYVRLRAKYDLQWTPHVYPGGWSSLTRSVTILLPCGVGAARLSHIARFTQ